VLPKWAIETWVLALIGEPLDETERIQPTHKQRAEREWRNAARILANCCAVKTKLAETFSPSLQVMCDNYGHLRNALRSRIEYRGDQFLQSLYREN
jgi:hypothetical protein